jgi:ATP-dependent DNA helicase RecG
MTENQNIEYKSSWHDEYLKWICGFANAYGGKIYIGKDDKGFVIGISNAKKLMEDIPNKVIDILGIIINVNLLIEEGKDYLEIIVEPYPNPVSYKGQYHYRSGSTKQELKGAALNKFLLQRTGKRWDSVTIPKLGVSDLKKEAIERYRTKANKSNRVDDEILNDTDEILLDDLHLIENDNLKRAAILLFHPKPEKYVQGAYIKIGFFHSDDDLAFQDEVHGCILDQLDKTEDLLKTKYTAYTISYLGISRIETPPFSEKAIREALLNAIVHKDYSDPTPIQISVYYDHIIFWNPGQLPVNWTVENLKMKHASKPFNPDIANALFRCGDIEAWGRGTLKMIRESIVHKCLPPDFNCNSTEFTITFYKDTRSSLTKKGIIPHKITIIEYVLENQFVSNSDVQRILKVTKRTASRYLNDLEKHFFERKGETGKGTIYVFKGYIPNFLKGTQRGHFGSGKSSKNNNILFEQDDKYL